MSVFSASMNHRSFYWQISVLCFVLGFLLAAAAFTASQIAERGGGTSRPGFWYSAEKAAEYQAEIVKLNQDKTALENKLAKGTSAASTLNKELQDLKFYAGLTEATGQGVQVTLNDSHRQPLVPTNEMKLSILIHDSDIAGVVNELKA